MHFLCYHQFLWTSSALGRLYLWDQMKPAMLFFEWAGRRFCVETRSHWWRLWFPTTIKVFLLTYFLVMHSVDNMDTLPSRTVQSIPSSSMIPAISYPGPNKAKANGRRPLALCNNARTLSVAFSQHPVRNPEERVGKVPRPGRLRIEVVLWDRGRHRPRLRNICPDGRGWQVEGTTT